MADNARTIDEQELVDAWRRALAEDHPNPHRRGCLDRALLEKAAVSLERLDGPERRLFIEHIGNCSPCSQDLKQLRTERKQE